MTSDDPVRNFVRAMYPGPKWQSRVDGMSREQVYAIYKAKQEKDAKLPDPAELPQPPEFEQGTLF